jgi:UDP-glucose 6-dehydrogenase
MAAEREKFWRAGKCFSQRGTGYSLSCFLKDTQTEAVTGRSYNSPFSIVETIIASSEKQRMKMIKKMNPSINLMGGGGD